MKKLLLLILLILIGCSEPEPINKDELIYLDSIWLKDDKPYSGSVFSLYKEEHLSDKFMLETFSYIIGKVKTEFILKDGKENGLYVEYGFDEEVRMTGNMKDGKQDGLWKYFYGSNLFREFNFKDGVRDGPFKEYSHLSLHGQVLEEGTYKNDEPNGSYVKYYETGRIKEKGNYKDGLLHGEITTYDETGNPSFPKNYINGKWDEVPPFWKKK